MHVCVRACVRACVGRSMVNKCIRHLKMNAKIYAYTLCNSDTFRIVCRWANK